MGITTDPNDPDLTRGVDEQPVAQAKKYLVLSEEELSNEYLRPVIRSYFHTKCGAITTMGIDIARTYARDPKFYGATYCVTCQRHLPVGEHGDFYWVVDGEVTEDKVGT